MDARTEGRIFGFAALAMALFGIAAVYQWREMPTLAICALFGGAAVFAALAIWPFLPDRVRRRMDPLLAIARTSLVIAVGALGIYATRGPQGTRADSPLKGELPNIGLVASDERQEIRWNPKRRVYDYYRARGQAGQRKVDCTGISSCKYWCCSCSGCQGKMANRHFWAARCN